MKSSLRFLLSVGRSQLNVPRYYTHTTEEKLIYDKLSKALCPKNLNVADISGGCGSMFAINVTSDRFKGLTMVKQHKLVNEILKDDIQRWHGLQLKTKSV
ncbi:hypothetical protein HG535_0E02290 [Zygotorulaspora mrakii]|uniref:Uncharacterized protein n=1 Tax=Zygotorulaspora mrakii TaxID=42260 RepID=A0A7H9B3A1_ZYGMR|nr:uncharacterized protein HG535_0E02290 [Zygotorulaspora mrakii]QLG73145.1 hypothetical protein HG535_0E02290 [Zygotorulaspora mrakii]